MPKLFLVFSHQLTETQREEAFRVLGVDSIQCLPEHLQVVWSQVPPELPSVQGHIQPIIDWLKVQVQTGDYLLIQGDYGATYHMVKWALANQCIPIYATTARKTLTAMENGKVVTSRVFEHVRFRFYE